MANFFLKDNINNLERYRQSLPDKIYLPLNMGRFITPQQEARGSYIDQRPSNAVDLGEWIRKQVTEGTLIIDTDNVITTAPYVINNITYDTGTDLTEILTSIVNTLTGVSNDTYIFTQDTPQTTWTINHTLARYPSVSIVDSSGNIVEGDVQYTSNNTIICTFSAGFAGKAYLN